MGYIHDLACVVFGHTQLHYVIHSKNVGLKLRTCDPSCATSSKGQTLVALVEYSLRLTKPCRILTQYE